MTPANRELLMHLYLTSRKHRPPREEWGFAIGLALLTLAFALVLILSSPASGATVAGAEKAKGGTPAAANSCVDCHSALDAPYQVTAEQFSQDVHAQKGLTCASCHGGDPTVDDQNAMSPKAGFRGKMTRDKIPEMCGKCHSDGAYMRQFNPSLRTDQLAQYRTSVHGKRFFGQHDTKVAVCIDCHGVHGIRPASDPRSKVHPLNIAGTCSRCHSNVDYMKGYNIPTEQFAGYTASVHAEAMTVRGDLSAPTCTTCHGNHGAAPPGLSSVENVCSTCHVFQAQLFDKSPHKPAFAAAGLPGCVTCHSNHRILRPTDAMVGTAPESTCVSCHSNGDAGYAAAGTMHTRLTQLQEAITRADGILGAAERSGMEVSQPKLDLDQARDNLTKARVGVHTFQVSGLDADIDSGMKTAEKEYTEGKKALAERDYRRIGLAMSLIAIALTLIGLRLYIKEIERNGS